MELLGIISAFCQTIKNMNYFWLLYVFFNSKLLLESFLDSSWLERYYGANKCLYTLDRFDTNGFNPLVHNKYMVDKARWEEYMKKVEGEDMVIIDSWRKLKVNCENIKKMYIPLF